MHNERSVLASIRVLPVTAALLLASCGGSEPPPAVVAEDSGQKFWSDLSALCGMAFEGSVVANEGAGAGPDPFDGQSLTMHVRECSDNEIRAPFHVGEDRSRTWVFTRVGDGLRFKHDHRHQDGSADDVTMYGGDAGGTDSATEQHFPADAESKDMFTRHGLDVSIDNTWVVGIVPGQSFSYALVRPGRNFRVEFDLTRPVEAPPAPWGG